MKKFLLAASLLGVLASCVPKSQYDALAAERNYYRTQALEADSLAKVESLSTYDSQGQAMNELDDRIQTLESLTATNVALYEGYEKLETRYNELLKQNQELLSAQGDGTSGVQQSLAQRSAEITQREAQLRQLELDLTAREQQVASLESAYRPAGGGEPAAYGRVAGTTPLNPSQNAALLANQIQEELRQALAPLPMEAYTLVPMADNRLQLVLQESALFADGFTLSVGGQNLLRQLAVTLRSYPGAIYTVVGHADATDGNALLAYENSTDRAITVATQLANFGLNSARITAGGKGFNAAVAASDTPAGQSANRRTELIIEIPR